MSLLHGIYIITGIMASGKSTIAQLLAEKCDRGAHVRGDLFRRMIVSGRAEMTQNPTQEAFGQLHLRYRLAARAAEAYHAAGFTTFVQDNYLGKDTYVLLKCFKSSPIFFITLCPSVQAVISREAARNKTGYTDWDVKSLNDVLVRENPRIGLWIDSSDQTPEETAEEIIAKYKAEARIL